MTISKHQQKLMQAGRDRRDRERKREATARVDAYLRWTRAGGDFRSMPTLPTDADFRLSGRGRR